MSDGVLALDNGQLVRWTRGLNIEDFRSGYESFPGYSHTGKVYAMPSPSSQVSRLEMLCTKCDALNGIQDPSGAAAMTSSRF